MKTLKGRAMKEHVSNTFHCRNETIMRAGMIALVTAVLIGCSANNTQNQNQTPDGSTVHAISGETNLLEGAWQHMPGATASADGLLIRHEDLQIVEQDGSGGQPNPPLNLYGTHLETTGDFAIDATINDQAGPAEIQLYGEVPITQDEFRIERKSMRLRVDGDSLGVTLWDGTKQQPLDEKTFAIPTSDAPNIGVEKQGQSLNLLVNGNKVGDVADPGIFSTHEVWFGAEAPKVGGHWLLSKLGAHGLHGAKLSMIDTSTLHVPPAEQAGLQDLATRKRPGFLFGAAMALAPTVADSEYAKTAFNNFGSMTTENALKWQFVHPEKDTYNFQEADALVELAARHNMVVHGHTLVFGEANPQWIQDMPTALPEQRQAVRDTMLDHIKTVVGHYKGNIKSWDVVNEPLTDNGTMREHVWYKAMGEQYIDAAFAEAHQTDPRAELYLNMYGAEQPGPIQDNLVALAKRLVDRGVPITGIGLQAHVYEAGDKIDHAALKHVIERFQALGLKVRISEMDVYSDDGSAVQAGQYASVLQTCLAEPNCVSFTTWGVSDRYDYWKDDDDSIQQGKDLLWDASMAPTPAVSAIRTTLQH
jgi:endo-1,4-beta-xylanase